MEWHNREAITADSPVSRYKQLGKAFSALWKKSGDETATIITKAIPKSANLQHPDTTKNGGPKRTLLSLQEINADLNPMNSRAGKSDPRYCHEHNQSPPHSSLWFTPKHSRRRLATANRSFWSKKKVFQELARRLNTIANRINCLVNCKLPDTQYSALKGTGEYQSLLKKDLNLMKET